MFAIILIVIAIIIFWPISIKKFADLNGDSQNETYILSYGHLSVYENNKIIWNTPYEWHIDNFVLADINNDGILDLNMSVWKAGNFGPSKPFWIKNNDNEIKNHFFIFDYKVGGFKPVWQSSNLERQNVEIDIRDTDGDGKNELVVVEADYGSDKCKENYKAIWKWNGWGFTNIWRSEKGSYCSK